MTSISYAIGANFKARDCHGNRKATSCTTSIISKRIILRSKLVLLIKIKIRNIMLPNI